MTVPLRPVDMMDIHVELDYPSPSEITLRDDEVYELADIPLSDPLGVVDLEGKELSKGITKATTGPMVNMNAHTFFGSPTVAGNYVLVVDHEISSSGYTTPALQSGTFPAGSTLTIVNNSYIRGAGGNGVSNGTGQPGGTSIYLTLPTTIDNTNGYIWAGGGGGGAGRLSGSYWGSGGGGAGKVPGQPGGSTSVGSGGAGTVTTGGAGGGSGNVWGGRGGDCGAPGAAGTYATSLAGGRGGYSIQRNGHTSTWVGGNDTTRVKGAQV